MAGGNEPESRDRLNERTPLLTSPEIKRVESPVSVDEESLLPGKSSSSSENERPTPSAKAIVSIISALLIAVFMSNADSSLVLATHTIIASDFNELGNSSWLFTTYALAQCAAQPLYGKLSDIYGRKSVLIVSYLVFTIGCGVLGVAPNFPLVLFGRILSGIGGGGMTSLVSILLTDLVPLRDIAVWRSYVNIIATTGRSLGGPIGGLLADTIGWRWSFISQCPIMFVAIVLCFFLVPNSTQSDDSEQVAEKTSKLRRIDFLGAFLLTFAIVAFLTPLELGGQKYAWTHPLIIASIVAAVILWVAFLLVEAYVAKEPIFPLQLMANWDVFTSYSIFFVQIAAQLGVMYTIPLYFQITANTSASVAGAHLIPAVVGNAVGGILSGIYIKRTGTYKRVTIAATLASSLCYLLLALRWHGNTNWWESMYVFLGGFGTGIVQSAIFVFLTAAVEAKETAVATSGLYLMGSGGMVAGLAIVSAVLQGALRLKLEKGLRGVEGSDGIIKRVIHDIGYARELQGHLKKTVVDAYVGSLEWTHGVSLLLAISGTFLGFLVREYKL